MIEFDRDKGILLGLAEGGRRVELIGQAVNTLGNIPDLNLKDRISH